MTLVVYLTHDDAGHDCYVWPLPNGHFLAMQTQNTDEALRRLAQDFNRFFTHPEEDAEDAKVVAAHYPMQCPWELRKVMCSVWDLCRGCSVSDYYSVRHGDCLIGDCLAV